MSRGLFFTVVGYVFYCCISVAFWLKKAQFGLKMIKLEFKEFQPENVVIATKKREIQLLLDSPNGAGGGTRTHTGLPNGF